MALTGLGALTRLRSNERVSAETSELHRNRLIEGIPQDRS
jgi:hypothetical protein